MATNYNESTVSGTSWLRSNRVVIENPYGVTPSIYFVEEKRIVLDNGEVIVQPTQGVTESFVDPNTTFLVIDQQTLQPTGQTMTYGEIYVTLLSLYHTLATKRDTQVSQLPI